MHKIIIALLLLIAIIWLLHSLLSKKAVLRRKMKAAYTTELQYLAGKASVESALDAWQKATHAAQRAGSELAELKAKFGTYCVHAHRDIHHANKEIAPTLIYPLLELAGKDEFYERFMLFLPRESTVLWHPLQMLLAILDNLAKHPQDVSERNLNQWRLEAIKVYEMLIGQENSSAFKAGESHAISGSYCKPAILYVPHVGYLLQRGEKEAAMNLVAELHQGYGDAPKNASDDPLAALRDILASEEYQQWHSAWQQQQLANLIDEKSEPVEKASRIHQNLHSYRAVTTQDEQIPGKSISTLYEVQKKYHREAFSWLLDAPPPILVLEGDTHINGNLDIGWIQVQFSEASSTPALLVAGNLSVDGDIACGDMQLEVLGDMSCHLLDFSRSSISVHGELRASYGIRFDSADSQLEYGSLMLKHNIKAPYLVCDWPDIYLEDLVYPSQYTDFNHSLMIACTESRSKNATFMMKAPEKKNAWAVAIADSWQLLQPEVWDEEGNFSPTQFFQLVRQGKNPFITPP
ncbi:hypothetical protein CO614_09860 [Lysobacteraceae bacterium NML120232]|nr:hypothetical protein CO614_09860 [Xanthomonadaceae bacterium NML120232]